MVFFASGDINFDRLVRLLEKATSDFPAAKPQLPDLDDKGTRLPDYSPGRHERNRSTHQAHVMTGNRAYGIHSSKRMPLYLLNNILGGPGMNAKLNLALRERNGLVYTVESSMVSYSDTGVWSVYFGCDHHHVERCLKLVGRELAKMAEQPMSDTRLAAAKRQLKGQIGIACDARENFALSFAKSFLHYGWERDMERLYRNIDEVTAQQVQEVAREVFDPRQLITLVFV
jgi:predicted Zn-dependent peptidase